MNQELSTKLLAALTAEHTALLSFTALLKREQEMLVTNSTEPLLELSEQKLSDAINLNKLAEIRRNLLQKNIPQLDVSSAKNTPQDARPSNSLTAKAIRSWLKMHNPGCLPVWQEIYTLAEHAQRLNNTNGELIQMKLRHNQQTLTMLSKAVNKANLYGPDGQTSFSTGGGRSLGSG